eukprot:TRINITY_DN92749_c0_g1_i4.p2 TRINITY_DN92749_c0_g1~~TRINITY_DN92749_c0_g1_i4.p2  ORF type:complete len:293 (+),score=47.79 TRINITY_DN92749_c0_g1_i4:3-881(+)
MSTVLKVTRKAPQVQAAIEEAQLRLPLSYEEAIRQAQISVQNAINDGIKLIEIEMPVTSLTSVPGDGEGANEMSLSMRYLKTFVSMFERSKEERSVRIFFPDKQELRVAQKGAAKELNANKQEVEPVFSGTQFKLDYLTKPSPFLDIGLDVTKFKASTKVREDDKYLIFAYPHFNVNEMLSVEELYTDIGTEKVPTIIVFNGELDRIRSGYYPPLFYPKVGKMAKNFIPLFTSAYYIHNFKGSKPGTLFRAYPGPWKVYRRNNFDFEDTKVVHSQDDMPTLKSVALDILPFS